MQFSKKCISTTTLTRSLCLTLRISLFPIYPLKQVFNGFQHIVGPGQRPIDNRSRQQYIRPGDMRRETLLTNDPSPAKHPITGPVVLNIMWMMSDFTIAIMVRRALYPAVILAVACHPVKLGAMKSGFIVGLGRTHLA